MVNVNVIHKLLQSMQKKMFTVRVANSAVILQQSCDALKKYSKHIGDNLMCLQGVYSSDLGKAIQHWPYSRICSTTND